MNIKHNIEIIVSGKMHDHNKTMSLVIKQKQVPTPDYFYFFFLIKKKTLLQYQCVYLIQYIGMYKYFKTRQIHYKTYLLVVLALCINQLFHVLKPLHAYLVITNIRFA